MGAGWAGRSQPWGHWGWPAQVAPTNLRGYGRLQPWEPWELFLVMLRMRRFVSWYDSVCNAIYAECQLIVLFKFFLKVFEFSLGLFHF